MCAAECMQCNTRSFPNTMAKNKTIAKGFACQSCMQELRIHFKFIEGIPAFELKPFITNHRVNQKMQFIATAIHRNSNSSLKRIHQEDKDNCDYLTAAYISGANIFRLAFLSVGVEGEWCQPLSFDTS